MLTGKITADKFIVVFEHDFEDPEMREEVEINCLFWRESCGYIQIWCIDGVVYDILKRDECRFMYE